MGYFTSGEALALAGSTVRVATLVDFEFDPDPAYVWNGIGSRVFDSKIYTGCGDLGSIEGLEEARGPVSQQVTFTLSGVPDSANDFLAVAIASGGVQGNLATVYLQLFDASWQVVGTLIPIYIGVMMPPRVTRQPATMEGGARRTVTLPTENIFYGRHRPRAGRYTDREQQTRYPGDLFCEYTPQLVNLTIVWPDY